MTACVTRSAIGFGPPPGLHHRRCWRGPSGSRFASFVTHHAVRMRKPLRADWPGCPARWRGGSPQGAGTAALSSLGMVDKPVEGEHADTDAQLDVLRLTDEVIGLSAELAELRAQVKRAGDRATAAAEVAQQADVAAQTAFERTQDFSEYLGEVTDGLGARGPMTGDVVSADLSALSREQLLARVEYLEAVLSRRSVQVALGMTKKLRGS